MKSGVSDPPGMILGVLDMYKRYSFAWYRWLVLICSYKKVDFDGISS